MSIHHHWLAACLLAVAAVATLTASDVQAQARRLAQDSTLNNLQLPPGSPTTTTGELGRIRKLGQGTRAMILLSGIGFGDGIWSDFAVRHAADFAMYAVTLPGFGGTPPYAMPVGEGTFARTPWITAATEAVRALIVRERLEGVTVVAHWAVASQIALRLALDSPERLARVVLIGGSPRAMFPGQARPMTVAQRQQYAETLAARWFRTVTRETWDDNNFMPYDYSINPRRGLFLWREAQAPLLPVWIRWLVEWYTEDRTADLAKLRVPILAVHPGFEDRDFYVEGENYMKSFALDGWKDVTSPAGLLRQVTIPGSRLFVMYDRPDDLDRELRAFVSGSSP